jgi:protein gp37
MKKHGIGWLNVPGFKPETWNPIVGCSKISAGCDNCYAELNASAGRLQQFERYAEVQDGQGNWNGKTVLHEPTLEKPLRWKKPRAIFVGSMTDHFHKNTPDEWVDQVLAVAALCPQHIFIVLTKRAERLERYFDEMLYSRVNKQIQKFPGHEKAYTHSSIAWPLPNLWLGVTAENQAMADERIPHLLRTPAAVRFVSVEPMVGPVKVNFNGECNGCVSFNCELHGSSELLQNCPATKKLDWVICGGESGSGARAMDPVWARSLRDQCEDAQVPFFFKQWGAGYLSSEFYMGCPSGYDSFDRNGGDVLDGVQHHNWPIGEGRDASAPVREGECDG